MTRRTPWTDAHIATLRLLWPTHSAAEIAAVIPHPERSIYAKARTIGLKKSVEWIAQRARDRTQRPDHGGRAFRFAPGNAAWNAGTKGQGVMKPNRTSFAPGNRPHTWRPIGANRISRDGYLQRKTADTGNTQRDYAYVHHLVWRLHGRTVPPGHILIFIDGDPSNIDINNLQLITRAQNMARNSTHRHGPEIAQISQLMGAIRRQINRKPQETDHA